MKERNIIQKEICEELGMAPYRLSRYLKETRPYITQFELYKLCKRLGISPRINVELE
jgi:transcriptional regulator with XRE-family HTH domain